ncbi:MAG TPA: hypothetical protein VH599_22505 [Ktedonobacterales bacterium]|jgi:hypothetical protein
MKTKGWHRSLIGLICLLPFLAGCGANLAAATPAPHALTVTRSQWPAGNRFPPFVKTSDDSAGVNRLYDAIQALPHFQGVYACANDDGLAYELTFALPGVPKQPITVAGTGCRGVTLSDSDMRMTNKAFWSLFAQTLGVSEADLFPDPLSN